MGNNATEIQNENSIPLDLFTPFKALYGVFQSIQIYVEQSFGIFLFMVAFRRKLAFCDISDCILSSLPKVDFIHSVSCQGGVAYSIILGRWPFTFTFTLLGFQRIEIWLLLLQNSNYQTFKFESLIKAYSSGRQCQYVFIIDDRQPLSSCPSLSNS